MKKLGLLVALIGAFAIASCGGSGDDGTTPEQAADNSINGFTNIVSSLAGCTTTTCSCSGGGTINLGGAGVQSLSKAQFTVVANSCRDSVTGLTYNGSMQYDDVTEQGSLDFQTFGECQNILGTATASETTCTGSLSGTCAGSTYQCDLTDDVQGDCQCQ